VNGDEFSDFDLLAGKLNVAMRLYGLQICETDGHLIAIRLFLADVSDFETRERLGTHGITYRQGCSSVSLPTHKINKGIIYY